MATDTLAEVRVSVPVSLGIGACLPRPAYIELVLDIKVSKGCSASVAFVTKTAGTRVD